MKPDARTMPGAPPLACYPVPFEALTGLRPDGFVELVNDVRPVITAAEEAKRNRHDRIRAPGAGRRHRLTLPDRVFTSLVASRFGAAEAQRVGYLVGASRDTVRRATRQLVPVMVSAGYGRICDRLCAADRQTRLLAACRNLPHHGGVLRYLAMRCGLTVREDGAVGLPGVDAAAA